MHIFHPNLWNRAQFIIDNCFGKKNTLPWAIQPREDVTELIIVPKWQIIYLERQKYNVSYTNVNICMLFDILHNVYSIACIE